MDDRTSGGPTSAAVAQAAARTITVVVVVVVHVVLALKRPLKLVASVLLPPSLIIRVWHHRSLPAIAVRIATCAQQAPRGRHTSPTVLRALLLLLPLRRS